MLDTLLAPLHLLLAVVGVADAVASGGMAGAIVITIATLTAAVLVLAALRVVPTAAHGPSPSRPRRTIDISCLLAQSDPDAAGHPRPRAPQAAASAA